jgi:hypothetical protein
VQDASKSHEMEKTVKETLVTFIEVVVFGGRWVGANAFSVTSSAKIIPGRLDFKPNLLLPGGRRSFPAAFNQNRVCLADAELVWISRRFLRC